MKLDSWLDGMKALILAFPIPNEEEGVKQERIALYRKHLDGPNGLSDEQWTYAVSECVQNETWFPTIARIKEYAEGYRAPFKALPLGETLRGFNTEEARAGLEMIRQKCREAGFEVDK